MTPEQLAAECRELSERLFALHESFEDKGWHAHAREILSMQSHLAIYAEQIEAKEKR